MSSENNMHATVFNHASVECYHDCWLRPPFWIAKLLRARVCGTFLISAFNFLSILLSRCHRFRCESQFHEDAPRSFKIAYIFHAIRKELGLEWTRYKHRRHFYNFGQWNLDKLLLFKTIDVIDIDKSSGTAILAPWFSTHKATSIQ